MLHLRQSGIARRRLAIVVVLVQGRGKTPTDRCSSGGHCENPWTGPGRRFVRHRRPGSRQVRARPRSSSCECSMDIAGPSGTTAQHRPKTAPSQHVGYGSLFSRSQWQCFDVSSCDDLRNDSLENNDPQSAVWWDQRLDQITGNGRASSPFDRWAPL